MFGENVESGGGGGRREGRKRVEGKQVSEVLEVADGLEGRE